ncbi:capsule polysaccharide export protein [Candidatus Kuenenia stuttgartiensis]|uniref:Capsule polysaccharide export protein n=2 Tax=Kuenenia stuttgartiensis TaxID=174633 RepID=Q1Q6U4_KUEST|nr:MULTISPECIES: SLBB domain-containing protein [Kuenenia]MCZ7622462.1 SLBB domain-containing protein [Candidatus Kuenenia sp.]QII12890.1 capsule polysaccharide export protein [Candidatus Kuenenia stuttgartiensis]CAJ73299.1 similar to capsular polysaccharide biosynthesis protein Wza [Candidatus Kuenenia stuttgartiensis]
MFKSFLVVLFVFFSLFIISKTNYADEPREQYTVNVDDVLQIIVQGHESLRTTAPVTSDGAISFPYVGVVYVKGMTLPDIEKELTKSLTGYIKYPVVSVSLSESKSMNYFMYGEVKNPGRFVLEDDITVLKALSTAGGITLDGLYGSVKLRRKLKDNQEYKEFNIDLKNTKESSTNIDMHLEAGDILVVEKSRYFFVYGEVMRPGKFTLEDNMTVLRSISMAGGFAKYGSPDRVKILRIVPGKPGYESIKVDVKGAMKGDVGKDILLEPDDIVVAAEGIL